MQQENIPSSFQDLITKFYYKQNNLCFQIILKMDNDETMPYAEFTDYNEYKIVFEKLSKMKQARPATPTTVNAEQSRPTIYA